jgi:carboxypeptidase Q
MQRRTLLQVAASLACGKAGAQAVGYSEDDLRHAALLREMALRGNAAYALVESLTTDIGARPAGSAADARAVQWAVAALRRLGLSNVRAESLPLRIWQRGPAAARLLAPAAHPLVMAALGNSVAAPAAGIEADVAWYTDLAALKADTSERARGKIVFIDQQTERTRDGRGYGAAVGARFSGAVEAARRGAVALAIRSIGTSGDRIAHTGAMAYDLTVPRIPAFAVSVPDAELLARLNQRGETLRLQFTLEARSDVEATTHNVIAEIPGSDLADEIVLLGAHLDSWDVGQGALDDGAGVAIVSAALGVLQKAGRKPRRTVRVVLFGNEENGFDGARHYGDRYGTAVHQLVSESDFGAGRAWRLASRVQPAALPLLDAIAAQLAPLGVVRGGNEGNPGPDAALLMRRHKWPAVALGQDGTNYFDVHHTDNDTLDKVDAAALTQNVACWAVVAWLAAQAPLPFGPPPL